MPSALHNVTLDSNTSLRTERVRVVSNTAAECKLKIMKLFDLRLNNCTETVYGCLFLQMTKMEMDCTLKYLASIFQSSCTHL